MGGAGVVLQQLAVRPAGQLFPMASSVSRLCRSRVCVPTASSDKVGLVTEYHHIPVAMNSKPHCASLKTRAVTGAWILTSTECLTIIKDKEMKKRHAQEEKEERRKCGKGKGSSVKK